MFSQQTLPSGVLAIILYIIMMNCGVMNDVNLRRILIFEFFLYKYKKCYT